jgi:hypothetical protein
MDAPATVIGLLTPPVVALELQATAVGESFKMKPLLCIPVGVLGW